MRIILYLYFLKIKFYKKKEWGEGERYLLGKNIIFF